MVACFFGVAFLPFLLARCVGEAAEALRFVPELASFAGDDDKFSDDLEPPRRAEERVEGMVVDYRSGGDVLVDLIERYLVGVRCANWYSNYKLNAEA